MKILQFTAENIKKLKVVSIKPDGTMVLITGANGQGKSSILDAVFMALGGKNAIPSTPIRHGEEKALVKLDFGEIVVTRRFTANGGTSLTVEAANGAKFPSPQAMLDGMLGALTFDPLEFARMKGKDQLDNLRQLVKLDIDIDQLDTVIAGQVETRKILNREIEQLQAKLPIVPADAPAEEVSMNALVAALAEGNRSNHECQQLLHSIETCKRERERNEKRIDELRGQINVCERAILAYNNQMFEETRRMPDLVDVSKLEAAIALSDEQNAKARVAKQHKILSTELSEKRLSLSGIENGIVYNRALRLRTMENGKYPIDGLSFGDGEILYNGIPFAQLATGEQIRISLAIAMEANPQIRIIRIKEGSLLDEGNLAMIEMMAMEKDFQVWVEKVDTSGQVGIVIEDGSVVS